MAELTPMMQQYVETKEQYSDCIVFPARGEKASGAQLKAMLEEVYIKPVENKN